MVIHILKVFFHRRVAPPFWFFQFPYQTGWQYSDGDANGGIECKRGIKNNDFRPISRFILGMMQDRGIVTMEGE